MGITAKISPAVNTVLFDLDGTLLPMDQEAFTGLYFQALSQKAAEFGYDEKIIVKSVWAATKVMMGNDGSMQNIDAFWRAFRAVLGEQAEELRVPFGSFYENEFHRVRAATHRHPCAPGLIAFLKAQGYTLAVATNPVFPMAANLSRLGWAGLSPADFVHITAYENARYCKPNPGYYADILARLGKRPEEAVMVGNDVLEDMAAASLGMETFLVTDCLQNPEKADYSGFPQGKFADLPEYFGNGDSGGMGTEGKHAKKYLE